MGLKAHSDFFCRIRWKRKKRSPYTKKQFQTKLEAILEKKIHQYWKTFQPSLFADVDCPQSKYTAKHTEIMVVLDWLDLANWDFGESGRGRPARSRLALASAFVAKAVLNLPTTDALIDRLKIDKVLRRMCAFEPLKKLPCEATFSNAFAEFSETQLPARIHETLIKTAFQGRQISNISRDSTAIEVRGKLDGKKKESGRELKEKSGAS